MSRLIKSIFFSVFALGLTLGVGVPEGFAGCQEGEACIANAGNEPICQGANGYRPCGWGNGNCVNC